MNESKSNHLSTRGRRNNRPKQNKRRGQRPATARQGRTAQADLLFATPLFPPRFRKRLNYDEVALSVASSAGSSNSYFFSANGLFDPNITGTGHQPMGFDQMMLMYEQYTVVSSKITCLCINASAASILNSAAIYLSPDTTQIAAPSRLLENGYITWKTFTPVFLAGSFGNLSLNCDVPTYMGRNRNKRSIVNDPDLFGTAAANPVEQIYFGILTFDPTLSNATTLDFTVQIEYEAIFWEPRKLTQS